ncbi:hypothetical protein [Rhizobium hidalgonense]|uniref:hypothetical protein n=1 Tax=Rhizobium hidalgonense TaxID=1538159 RepID=UPI001105B718|nr:hypothetical protein [Rhizobium hidalgonense]QKK27034.1 hypothetical protein FFM81_027680 [Rhizobium hidalgonense]
MSDIDRLIAIVRSRSAEHDKAITLLVAAKLWGQVLATIRQELDSLVRIFYLLDQPLNERAILAGQTLAGEIWSRKKPKGRVTDRQMMELYNALDGWAMRVYEFGCSFIHLSNSHGYAGCDPLASLSQQDRAEIGDYLRSYHGGPAEKEPLFEDIKPYLREVFNKVAQNLDYYLEGLEKGKNLHDTW